MDFWRQEGIIPSSLLKDASVTLIGAGGIGSPTALALVKMGIGSLKIYDWDIVEAHNLPNQLYRLGDIGQPKPAALKDILMRYNDGCRIQTYEIPYENQPLSNIVISAVDSMEAREKIFTSVKQYNPSLYIEARMGAELMRIYSVDPRNSDWYNKMLYPDNQTVDVACTAQAIIYNVFVIGGLIASQVKKFLMGQEVVKEIVLDLVTMTMITENEFPV